MVAQRPQSRIVVAEDNGDLRQLFELILPQLGHDVLGSVSAGTALVEVCRSLHPDLVIADVAMPHLDGIRATELICREKPTAVILLSGNYTQLTERAQLDHVMAFLGKPFTLNDLKQTIALAVERFNQFTEIIAQASGWRGALLDRRVVEQAKAVLMRGGTTTEAEAFECLKKRSQSAGKKLAETAQVIVAASAMSFG